MDLEKIYWLKVPRPDGTASGTGPKTAGPPNTNLWFSQSFMIITTVYSLKWISKIYKKRSSVYLQHSGSQLQTHQHRPVHQLGYPGVAHLQRVLDQVRDVHLPVGPQHGDDLVGALRGRGVELGQHLDQGPLVLKGAAPAHPALVVVVVRVAVSGAPWIGGKKWGIIAMENVLMESWIVFNSLNKRSCYPEPPVTNIWGSRVSCEMRQRVEKLEKLKSGGANASAVCPPEEIENPHEKHFKKLKTDHKPDRFSKPSSCCISMRAVCSGQNLLLFLQTTGPAAPQSTNI